MGSLQERFRQAEEIRLRQEREAAETRMGIQQGQVRAQLEAKEHKEAQDRAKLERAKKELPPILERFRVPQLLQEIRDDVWRVGSINLAYGFYPKDALGGERGEVYATYSLSFEYETARYETRTKTHNYHPIVRGLEEDTSPTETIFSGWVIGKTGTCLSVRTFHQAEESVFHDEEGYYLEVDDFGGMLGSTVGADRFVGSYNPNSQISIANPNAQAMLEEFLLRSCLNRKREGKLPLQLKAQGEEEIHDKVPWYRRLFR